ncbi:MAG TPA: N4-gp56 family major capsid protein [Candidatus Monoglobus merdigallinarum]|uniref:N4-gp56 family major capsid protein n=1 Tax=Candidatus Monoglobus merdigallinarum TaxID=2838698 RepID=A0A9D1TMG8_9FIRM|nr:N4-gp56 family major capsid protein [Candidatus Monoglobus merdigallinarum]
MSINYNTQTTLTNKTGNNLSPEMKAYYDRQMIRFASPKLVHAQFGQNKPIPKGAGKTIEFRRFSPLPKAMKPLTEGVTPKGNQLNVTTVESTVEQYGDYVTLSDMLTLSAIDNVIVETQNVLGDQAGRTLDTVIREKINAGTNVQYADGKTDRNVLVGGAASGNDYLSVAAVKRAVATLKRNNAQPVKDGCYVAIIHPDVANDLTNDPDWKEVKQNVDPKDWYNGTIGKIHGVVFIESTEAKIFRADPLRSMDNITIGDPESLTVASVSGKVITTAEEIATADATALSGRSIQINGFDYTISSAKAGEAGAATITVSEALSATVTPGSVIYPAGAGKNGREIYSTLFIGQNAYGVTSIAGGGLETIIKQKGSAGTGDPLDQRSTVGWKATQTAEILSPEFMVRVETTCSY